VRERKIRPRRRLLPFGIAVCVYIFFYVPCRRSAVPFQCEALARVRPARVYFPRLRRRTKKSLLRFRRRRRRRIRRRWRRLWSHNNRCIIFLFHLFRRHRGHCCYIAVAAAKSADNSQVRPHHHIVRQYRCDTFAFIRVKVSSFKIHCTIYNIHINLFFRIYIYSFKILKSDCLQRRTLKIHFK